MGALIAPVNFPAVDFDCSGGRINERHYKLISSLIFCKILLRRAIFLKEKRKKTLSAISTISSDCYVKRKAAEIFLKNSFVTENILLKLKSS